MATKIGRDNNVPDIYPCGKLHFGPIRGFCPPHIRSCLPNIHSASFLGSSNSLPPRPLRRFWRSIRQKTSFRARMCLLGVSKTNFYMLTRFSPKKTIFWSIFDGTENFGSKRALTWGASSVNAFASWMMNRQIDPYKSKYEVNFYPSFCACAADITM